MPQGTLSRNTPTSDVVKSIGIKGRMPSLRLSVIHHENIVPRTNIPLSPRTNYSTPWERNPKVILVYLLSSLRSINRQLSLCALSLCTLSPRTILSVDLHLHYGDQVYTITLEKPQAQESFIYHPLLFSLQPHENVN